MGVESRAGGAYVRPIQGQRRLQKGGACRGLRGNLGNTGITTTGEAGAAKGQEHTGGTVALGRTAKYSRGRRARAVAHIALGALLACDGARAFQVTLLWSR